MPQPHRAPLRERIPQSSLGANHTVEGQPPEVTSHTPPAQPSPSTEVATLGPREMRPHGINADLEWAQYMAKSNLLPRSFHEKPDNILWAVGYARSLNIPTMTALHSMYVIRGQPSMTAQLMAALVRRAGHRLYVKSDGTGLNRDARAVVLRQEDLKQIEALKSAGLDPTFEATWNISKAVTARLCSISDGKVRSRNDRGEPQPWELYPEAMLTARAISEVIRKSCQDVLMGAPYTPEELGAHVNEDGEPIEVDGSVISGGLVEPTVEPVGDADLGEFVEPTIGEDPPASGNDTYADTDTGADAGAGAAQTDETPAEFDPAQADHDQWRQEADAAAKNEDLDRLKELWRGVAHHRPSDTELKGFLEVCAERAKQTSNT